LGEGVRDLTLVLPFFSNMGMLAEHQQVWLDYPPTLRERLHVVVVDDCSPKGFRPGRKAVTVGGLASFRIYRLTQKKRWNWLACRNLGAEVAATDWLLLTDIDHVLPVETLSSLLLAPLRTDDAYRFRRVAAPHPWPYQLAECLTTRKDGTLEKPHNDSWLITRSLFFHPKVGGYDERLSGCYGTSGEFSDRLKAQARAHIIRSEVLIRYPRDIIADASTPPAVYTRKDDPINDAELAKRKAERETIPHWKPLRGLIPSELVYDSRQSVEAVA
jgi:hypothetical protein